MLHKNSRFSNNLSNFNDVAGRVFETPGLGHMLIFAIPSHTKKWFEFILDSNATLATNMEK